MTIHRLYTRWLGSTYTVGETMAHGGASPITRIDEPALSSWFEVYVDTGNGERLWAKVNPLYIARVEYALPAEGDADD